MKTPSTLSLESLREPLQKRRPRVQHTPPKRKKEPRAAIARVLSPIELSAKEKLEILQRLDRYRKWQALGELRFCLACAQIINGYDILVVGGNRETDSLRLICPTQGCQSTAKDWVIPSNEVPARMSMLEEEEAARWKKTTVKLMCRGKHTKVTPNGAIGLTAIR